MRLINSSQIRLQSRHVQCVCFLTVGDCGPSTLRCQPGHHSARWLSSSRRCKQPRRHLQTRRRFLSDTKTQVVLPGETSCFILPMYVNPSVPSEDELPDCLTLLGRDSSSSFEWHLFLPRGMYSRASGPLLGSRSTCDSTTWGAERQSLEGRMCFCEL